MLIRECLKQKDVTLSFEVFPPKPGMPFQPVQEAVTALSQYTPDFMSVTYGAGGGTSQNTIDIASFIQKECGTAALAHLSSEAGVRERSCSELIAGRTGRIGRIIWKKFSSAKKCDNFC